MKKIAALVLVVTLFSFDSAEQAAIAYRQKNYNIDNSFLALHGYDPVSYFEGRTPMMGIEKFQYNYKGINYRFSSSLNRDKFRQNPIMYEPQYGGWCTFHVANGEKIDINPLAYRITNRKLYLFNDFFTNSTFNGWVENYEVLKNYADTHWKQLQQQQALIPMSRHEY